MECAVPHARALSAAVPLTLLGAEAYVERKRAAAAEVGIEAAKFAVDLPAETPFDQAFTCVARREGEFCVVCA